MKTKEKHIHKFYSVKDINHQAYEAIERTVGQKCGLELLDLVGFVGVQDHAGRGDPSGPRALFLAW
jgi:hypothetical protein